MSRRLILAAAVLLSLVRPAPVPAHGRGDQERARAALAAGEIRPLAGILAEVERRYVGRVIEVELERRDERWVYELKLLPPSGRLFQLHIDAATGALIRSRGPVQEQP